MPVTKLQIYNYTRVPNSKNRNGLFESDQDGIDIL